MVSLSPNYLRCRCSGQLGQYKLELNEGAGSGIFVAQFQVRPTGIERDEGTEKLTEVKIIRQC